MNLSGGGIERLLFDEGLRLQLHEFVDVLLARPGLAADRENAGIRRQIAVQMRHVKRRQQLAERQVARAAEDDHVERQVGSA